MIFLSFNNIYLFYLAVLFLVIMNIKLNRINTFLRKLVGSLSFYVKNMKTFNIVNNQSIKEEISKRLEKIKKIQI